MWHTEKEKKQRGVLSFWPEQLSEWVISPWWGKLQEKHILGGTDQEFCFGHVKLGVPTRPAMLRRDVEQVVESTSQQAQHLTQETIKGTAK